jgi:hypothetical protein
MNRTIFVLIVTFFAWFALILQLRLTEGSVINFFSFFTILSNSLIALSLTFNLVFSKTKIGLFFSGISVQTAIALYIVVVGLVYNLVLRGIVVQTGWQLIVNNILHVLNPILYILYWIFFSPKDKLNWKNGIYWTIFPVIYLVYSLIRGAILNWYPYPFLNAGNIGYEKVFINIIAMIVLFFIAGLLLIVINNKWRINQNIRE